MGKIVALDIGDTWTGVALSDPLKIIASPYTTYKTENLTTHISELQEEEDIERIVIGYPKTLRGTESEQTQRTQKIAAQLQETFSHIPFTTWDERFSSKRAEILTTKKSNRKGEKRFSHARAAAFILDTYLKAHHTL